MKLKRIVLLTVGDALLASGVYLLGRRFFDYTSAIALACCIATLIPLTVFRHSRLLADRLLTGIQVAALTATAVAAGLTPLLAPAYEHLLFPVWLMLGSAGVIVTFKSVERLAKNGPRLGRSELENMRGRHARLLQLEEHLCTELQRLSRDGAIRPEILIALGELLEETRRERDVLKRELEDNVPLISLRPPPSFGDLPDERTSDQHVVRPHL